MSRVLNIFYGLKIRYVLISFVLLAIILTAAGYFSITAGQKATLAGLIQQGRALTTALVSSASNIISSDRQMTDIAIDELIAEVELVISGRSYISNQNFVEILNAQIGLTRVGIVDKNKIDLVELKTESRGLTPALDSLSNYFLNSIELDEQFDIIYDFYQIEDRRFIFGVLPYKNNQFVYIVYPWIIGQYADRKLSLAYLLNQLSQEIGIEYIMLQNIDGIVFASKQISQADRIEDDSFLTAALEADTALSRLVDFQDRKALEIVQTFNSGEEFSGLFRVGLSLYGYRQLTSNFKKQVWLFVVLLVILGLIGIAIVVGYQNINIMEDALNRARAISTSLHNSIAGIVLSTDEDINIVTANESARKHFGLPDGKPADWDYEKYFPDDPFKVKEVLKTKRPVSFETQIKSGNRQIDLMISTSLLINDKGESTGALVVAHDITEKRSLERQAHQASRLSELGTVAAGLAHDIRNPLNAIGMVIQRMENEITIAEDESDFDNFMMTLKTELDKLNIIIEKILQVAKSSRLELKETEIKPVIEEVISLYRFETSEHSIEIKSLLADGRAFINEVAFKGIISNLIKNAVEAIGDDGVIEISSSFDSDKMNVEVVDSGPGITDEQKTNLFKPFYTTKVSGTGLGLATAYKSAIDHSGDLKVESQPGGPTKFILTIPLKR